MRDTLFGNRLKKLRKTVGLTQEDVARTLNVKIRTYQNHEAGQWPNRRTQQKYISFFKCDRVWFLLGEGTPFSGQSTVPENSNKHELADGEGLYGKTRQREVEGTHLTITEFEPKEGQVKGPLRAAIEGLGEIFDSKDPVLIPTIEAVIHAARISAQREYQNNQQARQIKALENKCNEFKKRLEDLERKLENNPPHAHKEELIKQKAT